MSSYWVNRIGVYQNERSNQLSSYWVNRIGQCPQAKSGGLFTRPPAPLLLWGAGGPYPFESIMQPMA